MNYQLVTMLLYGLCRETDSHIGEVAECLGGVILSEEEMGQIREEILRRENQIDFKLTYDKLREMVFENEDDTW